MHHLFRRTDSLIAYILGYRLMAIMLAGVCGALIAAIVRRHAPQQVPAALLVWLWNPLPLVTTAIGAHNDMLDAGGAAGRAAALPAAALGGRAAGAGPGGA